LKRSAKPCLLFHNAGKHAAGWQKLKYPLLGWREDKITPIAAAQSMNEKIKHSIMSIIDHAGHLTNLENPSDFNFQVKQFIYPFAKKS
jgi:pimeloyl-ACP methyl ester carboxylesterase